MKNKLKKLFLTIVGLVVAVLGKFVGKKNAGIFKFVAFGAFVAAAVLVMALTKATFVSANDISESAAEYYLSFDVSKNVNADEITIGGIAVFRSGEQWKFSRIFWKIVGGFFLIVFTPVAIFVAVKIIIVVTAVIAVKVKDKKKVKDNSDNINVS